MVKKVPPEYANLNVAAIISYVPPEDKIAAWHTVSKHRESFVAIATQYGVPVARLVEFNFPGSVKNDRVNPDVVNWYLFHHERFRCHDVTDTTQDGLNYMFRRGQRVAIPHLGNLSLGSPKSPRAGGGTRFARWVAWKEDAKSRFRRFKTLDSDADPHGMIRRRPDPAASIRFGVNRGGSEAKIR